MWKWLRRICIEEELIPGNCECSHIRSAHKNGIGNCTVLVYPERNLKCACQIYIPVDQVSTSKDREVKELKRMAGLE